jgi:Mn-dependent DtxR family transcriptional regulator
MEIEHRLEAVLALIRAGAFSTPRIAEKLGVSVPTVSRAVCALRARGYRIRSERRDQGWCYVLEKSGMRIQSTSSDLPVSNLDALSADRVPSNAKTTEQNQQ